MMAPLMLAPGPALAPGAPAWPPVGDGAGVASAVRCTGVLGAAGVAAEGCCALGDAAGCAGCAAGCAGAPGMPLMAASWSWPDTHASNSTGETVNTRNFMF